MIACTFNLKYLNEDGHPVYIHIREFKSGCTWMGGYEVSKHHLSIEKLDEYARMMHGMLELSEHPVEVVP